MAKKYLNKFVIPKISANLVWLEISKHVIKSANKNLILITGYIHDVLSKYYGPNVFENLAVKSQKYAMKTHPWS